LPLAGKELSAQRGDDADPLTKVAQQPRLVLGEGVERGADVFGVFVVPPRDFSDELRIREAERRGDRLDQPAGQRKLRAPLVLGAQ
jgi:hypothetical protein